ncbi:MAG: WD40 repeat domain-containing protein, partial [Xenococcus sp. (in: cyanobacteria)]
RGLYRYIEELQLQSNNENIRRIRWDNICSDLKKLDYKKNQLSTNNTTNTIDQSLSTSKNEFSMVDSDILRKLREFKDKHQKSIALQLAHQSKLIIEQQHNQIELSVLLAIEAVRFHHSVETDSSLRDVLKFLPRPLAKLKNENGMADNSITFSPDGQYLATASSDGIARIWKWREIQNMPIQSIKHQPQYSPSLEEAKLYDYSHSLLKIFLSSDCLITLQQEFFRKLKLDQNGFPDSKPNTLFIWKINSNELIYRVPLSEYDNLDYVHINKTLLIVCSYINRHKYGFSSLITVKNIINNSLVDKTIIKHEKDIYCVALHPSGDVIAASDKNQIIFISINSNSIIQFIDVQNISTLKFSPNGQYLAFLTGINNDSHIHIWDWFTKTKIFCLAVKNHLCSISFSPDDKYLAAAFKRIGITYVWEIENKQEVARISHDKSVNDVAFCPIIQDKYILATASINTTQIWELVLRQEVFCLFHENQKNEIDRNQVFDIDFSRDNMYMVTASEDCSLTIWDLRSGKKIFGLLLENPVKVVSFSSNSKYLAAISKMKLSIWEWKSNFNQPFLEIINKHPIKNFAFSPNNQYFATSNQRNMIKIWEIDTGNEVKVFNHKYEIKSIAFSPNGKLLAAGSLKGITIIWDITTGNQVQELLPCKLDNDSK